MSRITYTKKGAPSVERTTKKGTAFERTYKTEGSKPINEASLSTRLLWGFGNLIGASQIKINAKKSRGFSIVNERPVKDADGNVVLNADGSVQTAPKTYASINLGRMVINKRLDNPTRDEWYLRAPLTSESLLLTNEILILAEMFGSKELWFVVSINSLHLVSLTLLCR